MATKKAVKKKAPANQAPATPAPAAPAAAPAQPVATAQATPKQPSQNGVTRPRSGTATGRVWEIADALSEQKGEAAARGEVMKAGEAEQLNQATIATQYGRWRKFHGLGRAVAAEVEEAEVEGEEEDEGEE